MIYCTQKLAGATCNWSCCKRGGPPPGTKVRPLPTPSQTSANNPTHAPQGGKSAWPSRLLIILMSIFYQLTYI